MGSEPGGGKLGLHLTGLKGLLRLDGGERERLRMTLRFSLTNGEGMESPLPEKATETDQDPGLGHVSCVLSVRYPSAPLVSDTAGLCFLLPGEQLIWALFLVLVSSVKCRPLLQGRWPRPWLLGMLPLTFPPEVRAGLVL